MPLFSPEAKPHLKTWLVRALEPICDADPNALAEYVAALLERDAPESQLRIDLSAELDEFLEKDGPNFINGLFNALRTQSYLPYSAASPSAGASADPGTDNATTSPSSSSNPASSPNGNRKRSLEDEGEHPPAKGPRLGNNVDGRRPPMGSAATMDPGHVNPHRQPGGPKVFIPPEQVHGVCRDYHVKGYCARGSLCKFSHSDDAIQPTGVMPFTPPSFVGMPPPFAMGNNDGYNPQNPQMDMGMQGQPSRGFIPGMGRFHYTPRPAITSRGQDHSRSGELPVIQDLTPKDPAASAGDNQSSEGPGSNGDGGYNQGRPIQRYDDRGMTNGGRGGGRMQQHRQPYPGRPQMPGMNLGMGMSMMPMMMDGGMNGMMGMNGMGGMMLGPFNGQPMPAPPMPSGGSQGVFAAPVPGFDMNDHAPPVTAPADGGPVRPARREDKTLVVEKIPADKLSIESITGWFQRFGSVTNVAVDRKGGKALVSFENHQSARDAWKAEDAVFSNRFVKVFWHRPMEGHGAMGNKMLAASANVVSKLGPSATDNSAPGPKAEQAERQQDLEALIAQQKELMTKLSSLTGDEKKAVFAELREVGAKVKALTAGGSFPTASKKPVPPPPSVSSKTSASTTPKPSLDADENMEGPQSSETEILKAQLAKLKAEAESLGIDPANPVGARGGYAGRARARGARGARGFYARGAGVGRGAGRASMKLDNRPRVLRVSGVAPEKMQGLKDWYEAAGGVDKFDFTDGNVLVFFKTRGAAEQGLAKGTNVPTVGQIDISWHTSPSMPKTGSSDTANIMREVSDADVTPVFEQDQHMTETMDDNDELSTLGWGSTADGSMI